MKEERHDNICVTRFVVKLGTKYLLPDWGIQKRLWGDLWHANLFETIPDMSKYPNCEYKEVTVVIKEK